MIRAGLAHPLMDGARDDIPRCEVREGVHAGHERFAGAVAQHRTFAAQRFGEERPRHRGVVQRGRVELHELHIGAGHAGPQRERDPVAGGQHWVGGDRETLTRATRREHGVRREEPLALAAGSDRLDTAAHPTVDDEVEGEPTLAHLDRAGIYGCDERALDLCAGCVTTGVHDARE